MLMSGHIEPEPVQVPSTQQPPPEHWLPAQHACPALPHCTQVSLLQAMPLELH